MKIILSFFASALILMSFGCSGDSAPGTESYQSRVPTDPNQIICADEGKQLTSAAYKFRNYSGKTLYPFSCNQANGICTKLSDGNICKTPVAWRTQGIIPGLTTTIIPSSENIFLMLLTKPPINHQVLSNDEYGELWIGPNSTKEDSLQITVGHSYRSACYMSGTAGNNECPKSHGKNQVCCTY